MITSVVYSFFYNNSHVVVCGPIFFEDGSLQILWKLFMQYMYLREVYLQSFTRGQYCFRGFALFVKASAVQC